MVHFGKYIFLGKITDINNCHSGVKSSIDDEYKWAGVEDPKIMITTSRDPSSRLKMFAKVCRVFVSFSNSTKIRSVIETIFVWVVYLWPKLNQRYNFISIVLPSITFSNHKQIDSYHNFYCKSLKIVNDLTFSYPIWGASRNLSMHRWSDKCGVWAWHSHNKCCWIILLRKIRGNIMFAGDKIDIPGFTTNKQGKLRNETTGSSMSIQWCHWSNFAVGTQGYSRYLRNIYLEIFNRVNFYHHFVKINHWQFFLDGIIVSHLPYGPTAYFTLSNVVMRHDIPDVGTMSEAYPHLIFHNFSSRLGERVFFFLNTFNLITFRFAHPHFNNPTISIKT